MGPIAECLNAEVVKCQWFDGFEGVCTIKEVDLFNNVGAFRSNPEVEGEEASVQGATHVEESIEFDGVSGGS